MVFKKDLYLRRITRAINFFLSINLLDFKETVYGTQAYVFILWPIEAFSMHIKPRETKQFST